MSQPAVPALSGLSPAEASAQFARWGANEVPTGRRFWAAETLLGALGKPLVAILLAASLVSGMLGETLNASLITAMVLLSIGLDFLQVYRSQQAATHLQALIPTTADVWRDGRLQAIPRREIVPDDILQLQAGTLQQFPETLRIDSRGASLEIPHDTVAMFRQTALVAADARLLEATTLTVDEAALTGESLPVEKRPGADATGRFWAGTSVVSGVGRAVVTATGSRTQFGGIARGLIEKAPPTAFEIGTRRFGLLILRTVVALVLFVFLVNALLRRDPLESFLFALALAVGLTPEFLPMIITVTLSQGALRMARSHVIVKRLAAIENLGNMDTLCSDKTGTLTLGTMVLEQHVDYRGRETEEVLRWACVNSALPSGLTSPLDAAILAHEHPAIADYVKLAELPFDFERRTVSVLARGPEGVQVLAKGAPEGLLPQCTSVDGPDLALPLTAERRQIAADTFDRLSSEGYRVLAIARRETRPDQQTLAPRTSIP